MTVSRDLSRHMSNDAVESCDFILNVYTKEVIRRILPAFVWSSSYDGKQSGNDGERDEEKQLLVY
jgi:hypothetical protein